MTYKKFFPIVLINEGNARDHWAVKHKRNKRQQKIITLTWKADRPEITLPCTVTLTKIGLRDWDEDNLIYSFKAIRDIIADLILPGKAPGQADGDKRFTWKYAQRKEKIYGVEIDIQPQ
jgi:hypothetical protein